MRRVSVKIARNSNPDEPVAIITGIGDTIAEAEREALKIFHAAERGLESNPRRKKKAKRPRRRNRVRRNRPARRRKVTRSVVVRRKVKKNRSTRRRNSSKPKKGSKAYWKAWAAKMKRARARAKRR